MLQTQSRVLACICVTNAGSMTAADLARRLRVSPASVSKAIGQLEGQEVIRRQRDPGQRRDRYTVDEDVMYRAVVGNLQRNAILAKTVRDGADTLGADTPAGSRMKTLGQFLDHLSHSLLTWMEQWCAARSPRQGAQGSDSETE
ncbi:GbsR/MarR family transcriptional regulator [Streptomyces alboflavus]|uniref:GbsR/MarR family transcriptional regulator n=1 Tax=Streptomyces alboflavus TaxID=67267 RepID=UPI00368E55D0